MSLEDVEKRRQERVRLKRKSTLGATYGADSDVVAMFQHNTPLNASRLTFIKHLPTETKSKVPIFTIKTEGTGSQNVVTMGTEVNTIDEGFDYAVAVVNKETGEVSYRSAVVYSFETKFAPDPEFLLGARKKAAVDYSANHELTTDDRAAKRAQLTENFGSSKKLKIQEAALKRAINDVTLDAMLKTAFASTSALTTIEEIKPEQISLVGKAQSSILPEATQAELPRDIYPISLFITDVEMESFQPIATEYLKTKRSELIEAGFPEIISKLMPNSVHNDPERAVAFTLLGCMTQFVILLGKGKSIMKKTIEEMCFPEAFVQKVTVDYLSADYDRGLNNKGTARMQVSSEQKERLVAHSLALSLTLSSNQTLPINPWQQQIKLPPSVIEKILNGLGCDIVQCSVDEAMRTGSMRAARLLKAPSKDAKRGIKRARR